MMYLSVTSIFEVKNSVIMPFSIVHLQIPSACLSVCLPVSQSVCLSACHSVSLSVCLPVCLPVNKNVDLHVI